MVIRNKIILRHKNQTPHCGRFIFVPKSGFEPGKAMTVAWVRQ